MDNRTLSREDQIGAVINQIVRASLGTIAEPRPGEHGDLAAVVDDVVRRAVLKADLNTATRFHSRIYASAGITGVDGHTDVTRQVVIGDLAVSSKGKGQAIQLSFQPYSGEKSDADS